MTILIELERVMLEEMYDANPEGMRAMLLMRLFRNNGYTPEQSVKEIVSIQPATLPGYVRIYVAAHIREDAQGEEQ